MLIFFKEIYCFVYYETSLYICKTFRKANVRKFVLLTFLHTI